LANAFEKRVKRNIVGRQHDFFIVVSPGLEDICLEEFKHKFPEIESFSATPGGIEFTSHIYEAFRANLELRSASKIVMRLSAFRATNFSGLENKISDIPWELYLKKGCSLTLGVSTKKSRLYHKEAIRERSEACIRKKLDAHSLMPTDKGIQQQVQIRALEDRFMVSLDMSGDLLFKRGIKTHGGVAPVRETIACGLLRLSGFQEHKPLYDPMCGSGTFTLEAAMMKNKIPPGWFRTFAFADWPCFKKERWEYLKKESGKKIHVLDTISIYSGDLDRKTCLKLEAVIKKQGFQNLVSIHSGDFFEKETHGFSGQPGLIILNPPYGKRISHGSEGDFYIRVYQLLFRDFKGWRFGIFTPSPLAASYAPVKVKQYPFFHGGLRIHLVTGTMRD